VSVSQCLNLATPLAPYLKEIPADPEASEESKFRYSIQMDGNNIITVRACDSTDGSISEVSR
jgi:hypothetical protein